MDGTISRRHKSASRAAHVVHFTSAFYNYVQVRDLAEPKVPEAPLLTLSGQPDLKIYDRLLTGSLAAVGVCA